MRNDTLRRAIDAYGKDIEASFILLDNPDFDNSIIGISDDNRVIYDEGRMASEFAEDNTTDDDSCSLTEAYEFIEYNTLRAIPYMGENRPIVIQISLEDLLEKYGEPSKQPE